jgi:chloramphenicol 3-O phosphotransferase
MVQARSVLIVLNGASSAGKTTIARALLSLLGPGCVVTGLDDILARVQPFGPKDGNVFLRGIRIACFGFTDGRLRLFKQLHREVAAQSMAGHDVIVETALMDPRALRDAAECFAPLEGWFVGIKPPLDISAQWEAARGDRPRGQARRHYELIHAHNTYDLVLDPSTRMPQQCAAAIVHRLAGSPPDAFRRLLN